MASTTNQNSIKYKNFMNYNCDVYLWNTNIVEFKNAECIVNCTGPNFEHGAGVAKAIHRAAGSKLKVQYEDYLKNYSYLNYEYVYPTNAFDLKNYKCILHVASPYDGLTGYTTILKNTIVNIFNSAFKTNDFGSIAMPFIGTGSNGIDAYEFLTEFCNAVREYFSLSSKIGNKNFEINLINNSDNLNHLSDLFNTIIGKYNNNNNGNGNGNSNDDDDKQDVAAAKIDKTDDNDKDKPKTEDENCVICMDKIDNEKKLDKCGHKFCTDCIDQYFKSVKKTCPVCGFVYGISKGTQPPGAMNVHKRREPLPGYGNYGSIEIDYIIPNGIQGPEHPHPKKPYLGTTRRAYLPDNKEGNEVLKLLTIAFNNSLIFTVGTSRTTNVDDCVIWNDIHHKTSVYGGPTNFGYPDPTYLNRVKEELAAKGIISEENLK